MKKVLVGFIVLFLCYSNVFGATQTFQGNVSGSAATLTTARTVNGTSFNGSANISIPVSGSSDYATSTWTPVWTPAAGSGVTHSNQVGLYTKIGNMVFFEFTLATNGHGTSSGAVSVAGLPVTSNATANYYATVTCSQASNMAITAGQNPTGLIGAGATVIGMYLWDATTGTTPLDAAEWGVSGSLKCSGFYHE